MFRNANVADPQLATTLLSLVNLAMTFIALLIMEKAGRRSLMMCTWVGMCTGFFVIFVSDFLGVEFGFLPTAMANAQERALPRFPGGKRHCKWAGGQAPRCGRTGRPGWDGVGMHFLIWDGVGMHFLIWERA